ncbi:MAG: MBL fold metallo-hydrolase [Chloroflexota bacterium]
MELTVLGAGPAYSDRPGATGAAYLVRSGATSILLDLGHGSFPALASRIDPATLACVLVSHLHPDHFVDLVPLRHYLRYQFTPPRRVPVRAPAGLAGRIDALHDEPGFTAVALDVTDLEPGPIAIGSFEVEARRVAHTSNSFAFRVTAAGGAGLVYSGDCGRASDLDPLVGPGDTLLVEVSFGPGPVPPGAGHLDGPAVGQLAGRTRPARVLLTHLQMGFDRDATIASVAAAFDGPVELVDPGFATSV